MISLRTHNILDYVIGAVLIVCPFVFGFSDILVARNVLIVLGVALVGYSLFTDYYYSISKIIPLGVHMTLDVFVGIVAILVPSLFNYRYQLTGGQYAIHWILGLAVMGMVALTRTRTNVLGRVVRDDIDIDKAA